LAAKTYGELPAHADPRHTVYPPHNRRKRQSLWTVFSEKGC